ncbi:MAG: hypothetical protein EBV06_09750, partial [Planctomycetia bacterium]|nr:hypothetical protein [Planctomycetia bacterium]
PPSSPGRAEIMIAESPPSYHPSFWVSADYLFGRINGPANNIPFLTTAPIGTPRERAGVRFDPNTYTLFGANLSDQNGFNEDPRAGFRVMTGFAIASNLALEAGFWMLESRSTTYFAESDGSTILARPFTNSTNQAEQSLLVAYPGVSSGSIDLSISSSAFYSGHVHVSETFLDRGWVKVDSLLGYRYYRYDTGVLISQSINPLEPEFVPGTKIETRDDIVARNQFHGAEIGLRTRLEWDSLSLSLLAKVAGGNLRREVRIAGSQTVTVPGQNPTTSPAGFYALGSNSGVHVGNDFTAVPEFGATLAWRFSPNFNVRVGYTLTQLGQTTSATRVIETVIDPGLLPPAEREAIRGDRPRVLLLKDDIWVQSLNLGAEFVW